MAHSGDSLPIVLAIDVDDVPAEDAQLDEIKFTMGEKEYTLTGGDIVLDETLGKYTLLVGENDTLNLSGTVPYQVFVAKGDSTGSTDIDYVTIGASLPHTKVTPDTQ